MVTGYPDDEFGTLSVLHNAGGDGFDNVVIHQIFRVGHSPLWADFDDDGDLDLVVLKSNPDPVGPPPGYANYFYVNQGDGTFAEDGWDRLGYVSTISGGTIATVADLDNDDDLDIVYALYDGRIEWLENDGSGYFQSQSLLTVSAAFMFPTDITSLDYDLDGYQDILVGYGDPYVVHGNSSIHLLGNRDDSGDRTLVDESAAAGVTGTAFLAGLAPADYNRDGFTDLYLSRESNESFLYKARPPPARARTTGWACASAPPTAPTTPTAWAPR